MGFLHLCTKYNLQLILVTILVSACEFESGVKEVLKNKKVKSTFDNKASYHLGQLVGKSLSKLHLTEEERELFWMGLSDSLDSKSIKYDYEQFSFDFSKFLSDKKKDILIANKVKAKSYFNKFIQSSYLEISNYIFVRIHNQSFNLKLNNFIKENISKTALTAADIEMDLSYIDKESDERIIIAEKSSVQVESLPSGLWKISLLLKRFQSHFKLNGPVNLDIFLFSEEGFQDMGAGNIEPGEHLHYSIKVY